MRNKEEREVNVILIILFRLSQLKFFNLKIQPKLVCCVGIILMLFLFGHCVGNLRQIGRYKFISGFLKYFQFLPDKTQLFYIFE
jgi:hypothetical protein